MINPANASALSTALDYATRQLLSYRVDGHWRGELSSSALSTATAVLALTLFDRATLSPKSKVESPKSETARLHHSQYPEGACTTHHDLIERGLGWLLRTQNEDGGWGDTVLSVSNISTTALV